MLGFEGPMFKCCSRRKWNNVINTEKDGHGYKMSMYPEHILMIDRVHKTIIKEIKGFNQWLPDGMWLETSVTDENLCYVSSIKFFCGGMPSGCWRQFSSSGWETWKCCFDEGTRHGIEIHFIGKNIPDTSTEYTNGTRDGDSYKFSRSSETQYAIKTVYNMGIIKKRTVLSKDECFGIERELSRNALGQSILKTIPIIENEYDPKTFNPYKYFSSLY